MGRRKRDFNGTTKTEEQTIDNQDRFSKLPEELIIDILSLLGLKDAVKTGVLAKRWKNLWTKVHNIVLERHTGYDGDEELPDNQRIEILELKDKRWTSSVDHTLTQCTAENINRFCLSTYFNISNVIIDKWISYALDRNVKTMELTNFCDVPVRLYQSSSITTLELWNVSNFCLSSQVNFSSLKSLLLDYSPLDDASLEKILMGCPVLENLVLSFVFNLHHITIMSPSVKRFKLYWFEIVDEIDFLNIKAPWLQELELSGKFVTTQCQLVDVSSLTKATLTFHTEVPVVDMLETEEEDMEANNEVIRYNIRWIPMVTQLIDSLSNVGDLTIGSEPLQVLTLSRLLCRPSPLFKCKHLSIETSLWKFDLPGIVCLLENAPHLETLFIKVLDDWQDAFPLYQTEELFEYGDRHLSMPNGKFLHLKNVTIDYWRSSCCDDSKNCYGDYFDFELVEYILKSAVILGKLVLCSSSGSCRYECTVRNCVFQYVPRLSAKLLSTFLSRNESAAEWELKKSKNKFVYIFHNYASLRPSSSSSYSP